MAEVIFPCTHMNNLSEKCLKINMRYTYQTFELLYYIDVDGRQFSTPYLPSPTVLESDLIDPFFCPDCQESFLEFFKSMCGHNYAISVLEHLCAAVNRYADNLVKQKAVNEDEGEGGVEEYRFTFCVKEYIRRPFTEEELMEWVTDTTSAAVPTPAAESAIEALQTVGTADVAKDEKCTVCLEELLVSSDDGGEVIIKRLPCQHVFHADCIATWLRTSHVCPLCRYELEVHQSDDDNDNDGEAEEEAEEDVFDDAIDHEDDDGELFCDAADDYIFSDDDDEAYDDEDEQEQEDDEEKEDDEDEQEQEQEQEEEKYNCGELSWVIYYDQLDM